VKNPVQEFEQAFSKKIGVEYAIAVNSGTSALHAALVACDVAGGDVVLPALCPAMDAFAVIHAGARPVFADVDPHTGLITAGEIKRVVTPDTRAILAVHLHGLPCDMGPIAKIAYNVDAFVIEDCAQCLLGRYDDRYAGSLGDIACFSFEKKKHMSTGSEGGMIVSDNPHLMTRARKFAGIGYKHMTADSGRTSLSAATFQRPDYERFDTIGLNYRMSEIQANYGLVKLEELDRDVDLRKEIGLLWTSVLGPLQPHSYDAENVYYSAAFENRMGDWLGFYE
jgi:perosamine synthetase